MRIAILVIAALMSVMGERARAAQTISAQGAGLSADEVLASSATHFPQILEALARRRAAEGDVLAADGAFDLVFSADGFDRVSGFWTGRVVNTQVSRNLRAFGGSVYGGYRVSDGTFPIYEDINFTNTGGEGKVGAIFSLLRDRTIDQRRFQTRDARFALQQADLEVLLTRIGVQHKALVAYWRWVAAGHQLAVYQNLLDIAQKRERGLEEQVRQGARAAIFITENKQNITRRQRLVTEAERDLAVAANALSFYYRDESGAPRTPDVRQLPATFENADPSRVRGADETIMASLAQRPELQILQTTLRRARQEIELGKNNLKPRLDLNGEVSRDFGSVAEGGISRDSTDVIVGFRFSVPFQQREARGRLRAARAKADALEQEQRRLRDQLEIEVRNILIDLDTSENLTDLALQEFEQSETMKRAEQDRFASGASDFFLVNIREETAAEAQTRYLIAILQQQVAQANFDAATVNLERFGISNVM
ncbi:MAG: TolC family protein [Pseudomonadota bacterium]